LGKLKLREQFKLSHGGVFAVLTLTGRAILSGWTLLPASVQRADLSGCVTADRLVYASLRIPCAFPVRETIPIEKRCTAAGPKGLSQKHADDTDETDFRRSIIKCVF
jgi:hypothetical protein